MTQLRVLAIHRYYWPDTPPYASLLRAIAAHWSESGHHVDILSSQPSYKPELENRRRPRLERVDGLAVRRIAMRPDRRGRLQRLRNLVRFPLFVAWRIMRGPRYDVVMCSTAPPVLLGAATSLAAHFRGAKFVYHCMDLHPEIGSISGEFAHPLVGRALLALERATCRRASVIVVLSEDMRAALLRRDAGLADSVFVLNNFDLPDFDRQEVQPPLAAAPDRLRIAFTGNVGRFQDLEVVTRAVLDDPDLSDVELVFMGEGAAKADLQRLTDAAPADRRERVRFLPHGSAAEARALLATADLGLVSLIPGVIEFAYPSKTATYLSASLPILVSVERGSELARTVVDEGIGAWLPADATGVASVLRALVADRARIAAMRERAHDVWTKEFSAAELLPHWNAVLSRAVRR